MTGKQKIIDNEKDYCSVASIRSDRRFFAGKNPESGRMYSVCYSTQSATGEAGSAKRDL
jgi:hypothetical protein